MTMWFTGSSSTLSMRVVPYSSLLVCLRSVRHGRSFRLQGVPVWAAPLMRQEVRIVGRVHVTLVQQGL